MDVILFRLRLGWTMILLPMAFIPTWAYLIAHSPVYSFVEYLRIVGILQTIYLALFLLGMKAIWSVRDPLYN